MNSVMSSRNTIAYLLMALKKVTELLLLWSIETTLSVFDYLPARIFRAELYARLLAIDVVRRSKEKIPCQVCNLSTALILTQILFKSF